MVFADRTEAGRLLAARLAREEPTTACPRLVAALPRGGVLVGAEVATALGVPLEVMVVKKIGAPGQPEVAIGAVTQDGTVLLHEDLIARVNIPRSYLLSEGRRQAVEIGQRLSILRGEKPPVAWRGKEVMVIDDGIATGYTVRAAIAGLRSAGVAAVWVAVPVAPVETVEDLSVLVDKLVVLHVPEVFYAVGQFYERFDQVGEDEVRELLERQ